MNATQTIKLYEVRYFPAGSGVSKNISSKCRIVPFRKAQAIVKRLKKAGVDAVVGSAWRVNAAA
jgi:hypothetical protein